MLREGESLRHYHTARKDQSWDVGLSHCDFKAVALPPALPCLSLRPWEPCRRQDSLIHI